MRDVIESMHDLAIGRARDPVGGAIADGDQWLLDRIRAKGLGMRELGVFHGAGELARCCVRLNQKDETK